MKLSKLFEQTDNLDKSAFLDRVVRGRWFWNPDGTVDVEGSVDLARKAPNIEVLPVRFNVVTETFYCSPQMVTLHGVPKKCDIFIGHNMKNLRNLSHLPQEVRRFGMSGLKITKMDKTLRDVKELFALKQSPLKEIAWPTGSYTEVDVAQTAITNFGKLRKRVRKLDVLYASDCQFLTSFKGLPDVVDRLHVENCNIRELNFPPNVKHIGVLYIKGNPVVELGFEKPDFVGEIRT